MKHKISKTRRKILRNSFRKTLKTLRRFERGELQLSKRLMGLWGPWTFARCQRLGISFPAKLEELRSIDKKSLICHVFYSKNRLTSRDGVL